MQLETKQDIKDEVKSDVKEELVEMKMATALTEREHRDLGFGSIVSRESRLRFINPDGSFNVRRKGLAYVSSLNFSTFHSRYPGRSFWESFWFCIFQQRFFRFALHALRRRRAG